MHFTVLKEGLEDKITRALNKISITGSMTCGELEVIIRWDSVDSDGYHYETIKNEWGWNYDHLKLEDFYIDSLVDQPDYAKVSIPSPQKIIFEVEGINDSGQRISYGEDMAVREPSSGKGRFDLITPFGIQRLARWYELGAQKYSDRNWEKGIPFSRYVDSASRHLNKFIMGMTDEDHLAAAAWNILAIIHHQELGQTDLDDMPHYLTKKEETEE